VNDDLAFPGELFKKPEANIIKLPNISASISQLKDALLFRDHHILASPMKTAWRVTVMISHRLRDFSGESLKNLYSIWFP